jgi:hypothetical protein
VSEIYDENAPWSPDEVSNDVATESAAREAHVIGTSLPILQEVIDWFEEQSLALQSVSSLDVTEDTPADEAKLRLLLNKKLTVIFLAKATEFENRFKEFVANKD